MTSGGYDPDLRRDTPLARKLAAQIRRSGPMRIGAYMSACLLDEEYGFYVRSEAIGRDGGFTTAPEISQVFGELIGLWTAATWRAMGAPSRFALIELGPGRGTLMADLLRAARIVPGFRAAAEVILVEAGDAMRARQVETLAGVTFRHVAAVKSCAGLGLPVIAIGNEFLDCLPIEQTVRLRKAVSVGEGENLLGVRVVDVDGEGRLQFDVTTHPPPDWVMPPSYRDKPVVVERKRAAEIRQHVDYEVVAIEEARRVTPLFADLAKVAAGAPCAALFLDYGHMQSAPGDTLQAVRAHAYEHPLTSPGEADVTALVDFAATAADARSAGFDVDGPTTQAEFLGRLGIVERASKLMAANPGKAAQIEAGIARLIAPGSMGTRFKAIAVRSPGLARLLAL